MRRQHIGDAARHKDDYLEFSTFLLACKCDVAEERRVVKAEHIQARAGIVVFHNPQYNQRFAESALALSQRHIHGNQRARKHEHQPGIRADDRNNPEARFHAREIFACIPAATPGVLPTGWHL